MRSLGLILSLAWLWAAPVWAEDGSELERLRREALDKPTSVQAWDRVGQALARSRRFTEAQQAFDRALRLDPGSKTVRHHVAVAHAWRGDYGEALKHYRALLKDFPRDSGIHLDYGQTLAWDGQFEAARREYEKVLEREPGNVDGLRHIGILTAWEGDYASAIEWLDRGLALAPDDRGLLFDKSEVLSWQGELAKAASLLRGLLEKSPDDVGVLGKLGQVYFWEGRLRDAERTYRRALELDPDRIHTYLGLADVYADARQYKKAQAVLTRARGRFPADRRLTERLSALAAQQSPGLAEIAERIEPLLFIVILLVVFRYAWRYRRAMGHHRPLAGRLFALLPYLAGLTALGYAFVLFGGVYYHREMEAANDILEALNLLVLLSVFFSLLWLLRFERPARKQTVLAIGAHPDDIEFGVGATLLRYREEGCATHGLVLTGGEKGAEGEHAARRGQEAQRSAAVIALSDATVLDFPDTRLAQHRSEIKEAIEAEVARIQPDIVFTHNNADLHSDHQAVFEATREAARGACSILCYENPNTPPEFKPDYFVDITDYLEDKLAALARHKSQAGKAYIEPEVVRSSAAFRGNQARVKYAEAFKIVRFLEKPLL